MYKFLRSNHYYTKDMAIITDLRCGTCGSPMVRAATPAPPNLDNPMSYYRSLALECESINLGCTANGLVYPAHLDMERLPEKYTFTIVEGPQSAETETV